MSFDLLLIGTEILWVSFTELEKVVVKHKCEYARLKKHDVISASKSKKSVL